MTAFEPETQRYTAIPMYKGSFTEVGEYTNTISTGKVVSLKYTTEWRWGECIVDITKKEYADIIKSDGVCLTDYNCEFEESTGGWSGGAVIHDEDSYTIEEMREIIKSTCDPNESSDDESDEEEQEPTVVKQDEFGNYNVTIAPPIESETRSDHSAFSEWFDSTIRSFEDIEADDEDVEEIMKKWCEDNNHEWRDDGVYNMNIRVPPAPAPAAGGGVENNEDEGLTLDDCNQCGLDNGGWDLDETYYYIYSGVVLVPEGENIDDYEQGDGSYANKEDPANVFENISIHI